MSDSEWFDDVDAAKEAHIVPVNGILTADSGKQEKALALRELEDGLLAESLDIVRNTMRFAEIDPSKGEPPPEWLEKFGDKRAMEVWRTARAAWAAKGEAPVALDIASRTALGIIKARATENSKNKQPTLNVTAVVVNVTNHRVYEPLYEEEVE